MYATDYEKILALNIDPSLLDAAIAKGADVGILLKRLKVLFCFSSKLEEKLKFQNVWQVYLLGIVDQSFTDLNDIDWKSKDNWGNGIAHYAAWSGNIVLLEYIKKNHNHLLLELNQMRDSFAVYANFSFNSSATEWVQINNLTPRAHIGTRESASFRGIQYRNDEYSMAGGLTGLIYAAQGNRTHELKLCYLLGANLLAKGSFDNTALVWAIANSSLEAALLLLDRTLITDNSLMLAQINKAGGHGNTPLLLAMAKGAAHKNTESQSPLSQRKVITRLLELGANIHAQNNEGFSPLHFACVHRDIQLIKQLTEHGARFDLKNNAGVMPIELCFYSLDQSKKILATQTAPITLERAGWNAEDTFFEELRQVIIKTAPEYEVMIPPRQPIQAAPRNEKNSVVDHKVTQDLLNCLLPIKNKIIMLEHDTSTLSMKKVSILRVLYETLSESINKGPVSTNLISDIKSQLHLAEKNVFLNAERHTLRKVIIFVLNVLTRLLGITPTNDRKPCGAFFNHKTTTRNMLESISHCEALRI